VFHDINESLDQADNKQPNTRPCAKAFVQDEACPFYDGVVQK